MLNGDKCHRKTAQRRGEGSSEILGIIEVIINREVRIELTTVKRQI